MNIQEALNVLNLSGDVTEKAITSARRKLALKFHPDRNPLGGELMKAVNSAFDTLMKHINIINDVKSSEESDFYDFGEKLESVLNELLHMEGVIFEVMGNWIWISGDTKKHKDAIKALGCKWASKKKQWFYRPEEYKSRANRSEMSIEEIREKYGTGGKHAGRSGKGQRIENPNQAISR